MGALKPLPTPPGPCAWAGYPSVSLPRGAVGERNAARFFAASAAPQSGRVGNETMAFFFQHFGPRGPPQTKGGIPTLLPTTRIRFIFFHQKRPVPQNATSGV